MSNMALEDLMNALAHWGTVTVQRKRFPIAASPGLKGKPVLWEATVRIPGYQNKYGQPYFTFHGRDIRQAVEQCYDAAEAYLYSDEGRTHRKKAVDDRAKHNAAAERMNPGNRSSYLPRTYGPIAPDVVGPDAPAIDLETY